MKRPVRLYNILLPIWLLFLLPTVWLVVLPGNLIIDCAVVFLTLLALKHTQKKAVLRHAWWRVWLLGFGSDFVGVAFLLPTMFLLDFLPEPWRFLLEPVMYNPFKSWLAFVVTLIAVAVAGVCIYFFDRRALRSCSALNDRQRHVVALTLAIITAPWTFFIPMS
ncbi:MAG: hypothetical protein IJA11_07250 [Oscillospiraceae bacterium]|nr:hypothetical protein [Oscillospiraceae bacterium]